LLEQITFYLIRNCRGFLQPNLKISYNFVFRKTETAEEVAAKKKKKDSGYQFSNFNAW
jgi:hypothetical protein